MLFTFLIGSIFLFVAIVCGVIHRGDFDFDAAKLAPISEACNKTNEKNSSCEFGTIPPD